MPLTITIKHTLTADDIGQKRNQILLDGQAIEVVLSKEWIYIGCTKVSPRALNHIANQWAEHFPPSKVVTI